MQTQIEFITDLSRQYKLYAENSDELFKAINELSRDALESIYAEYGAGERNFQPVNLLRAEIARLRLENILIDNAVVEKTKDEIRDSDPDKTSESYVIFNLSKFKMMGWESLWSVFHSFFYREKVKETVQLYINQIGKQMYEDLQLPNYEMKWFDFSDPLSFYSRSCPNIDGHKLCWIGFYPKVVPSDKNAYQFALILDSSPRAGRFTESSLIDEDEREETHLIENYEDAFQVLRTFQDEITAVNKQLLENRRFYKFAPGEQASQWDRFKEEKIAALNFSSLNIGDLREFESFAELNKSAGVSNLSNQTGNLWLFRTANLGDVIFANKGVNICLGIGIIEGDYEFLETDDDDYSHRRKVRWISDEIYQYEAHKYSWYKTLFRPDTFSPSKPWQFILSEYVRLYPELKAVFDAENLIYDAPTQLEPDAETEIGEIEFRDEIVEADAYDFTSDADKPFISEADFMQAVKLLKRKKNIILQGSPGVGKTFIARKLAYQIIGRKADSQIGMVQFHQSFAYEDFVQGLRLVKDGTVIKNGIFYRFCQLAVNHPEQDFFFIIDEINRGNLSKIFGELMMLIEHDKRDAHYALKLTYADEEGEKFFVPPNVHLIGTMNTADRSLAIVDYALRRRFAFFDLTPQFGQDFRDFLQSKGVSEKLTAHVCGAVEEVNRRIAADPNLGAGFCIGHSYFCDGAIGGDENHWFREILQYEIHPLLEEIWFDDREQINRSVEKLEF